MSRDNAILFPGAALYRSVTQLDRAIVNAPHSWKLVIPVEGSLDLTFHGFRGAIPAGKALLLRANTTHLLVGGPKKVVFFVEPELCRTLAPQRSEPTILAGGTGTRLRDFGKEVLRTTATDRSALQSILSTSIDLVARERIQPRQPLHPRVEDALHWLRQPWLKLDHKTIAKRSGISPSRLSHLLKEQLGISGKRYALWVRTVHGIQQMSRGIMVKDVAKQAGFHDLAHFSRSVRGFFGMPPSNMPSAISVIRGGLYGPLMGPADEPPVERRCP